MRNTSQLGRRVHGRHNRRRDRSAAKTSATGSEFLGEVTRRAAAREYGFVPPASSARPRAPLRIRHSAQGDSFETVRRDVFAVQWRRDVVRSDPNQDFTRARRGLRPGRPRRRCREGEILSELSVSAEHDFECRVDRPDVPAAGRRRKVESRAGVEQGIRTRGAEHAERRDTRVGRTVARARARVAARRRELLSARNLPGHRQQGERCRSGGRADPGVQDGSSGKSYSRSSGESVSGSSTAAPAARPPARRR